MGQKKSRLAQFLIQHPKCCYCGGGVDAESIDHVPPRAIFKGKLRPAGLEVPACSHCNAAHSPFDEFFAFIAFLQLSSKANHVEPRFDSMISGLVPRFPEAMVEIVRKSKRGWVKDASGLLRPVIVATFEEPAVHFAVEYMAARISSALVYVFHGASVPLRTCFKTRWVSNASGDRAAVVKLAHGLPNYISLKQGSFDTSDQFEARYFIEDRTRAGFVFNFHRSFQVTCVVEPEAQRGEEGPLFTVTRDGIAPLNHDYPPSLRIPVRR